jgi:hypothetical protein
MGLDIVAYSRLIKEPAPEAKEVMEKLLTPMGEEVITVHESENNPWGFDLEPGAWLSTEETVEHHFRAGSYSGYNQFRNMLSNALLGVPSDYVWEDEASFEGKPGYEMVNFSDCQGVISWSIAEKLYNDLVGNRIKFVEYVGSIYGADNDETEHLTYVYDNFITAFELAKNNGVVVYC